MVEGKNARGSLIIVGTGISVVGQLTIEARTYIERAAKLFYLVADPTTGYYLKTVNETAESLYSLYEIGMDRMVTYNKMVERILSEVRQGKEVCAAFYGHPGVFAFPSHEAIRRARAEGYYAKMLPGISTVDCLVADLGVDPGSSGCQTFEATDFLLYRRRFDPNSILILLQIGLIGDVSFKAGGYESFGLPVLSDYLTEFYGCDHRCVVYEASHYAFCEPGRDIVVLGELHAARITPISTLYVPPKNDSSLDVPMLMRLGMSKDSQ